MHQSRGRILTFIVACLIQPAWALAGMARVSAMDDEGRLRAAVEERQAFGLRADEDFVTSLIASGATSAGSSLGLAFTADEAGRIDIDGRMRFANEVAETVIPFARAREDFAGAYIDQAAGGRLVLLFVSPDDRLKAEIAAREPNPSLGIAVRTARHSYAALRAAVEEVPAVWPKAVGPVPFFGVGIDVPRNSLRVEVDGSLLAAVSASVADLESSLSIPVEVVEGEPSEPAAQTCPSRTTCYNPMEAGVRVSGDYVCGMGFHITIGRDEQFVTAGHCGYGGQATFSMTGYGIIGSEQGTLFGPSGDDVMKVQMGDSQASDWIYGSTAIVGGYRAPIYGEAICASLRRTDTIDCGTVSDDFKGYNITAAWGTYFVFGGDAQGIFIQTGDSGSPVYVRIGAQAIAIGVVSTTGQEYGLMSETLPIWGAVPF